LKGGEKHKMANGLFRTDDTSVREDLLSVMKDVSPNKDNWLFDNLGTSVAKDVVHQWLTDNVVRETSVSNEAEGADWADDDNSQPVRSSNLTSITTAAVRVTGTERAVNVGLPGDPMDYQKTKALGILKNKIEFKLLRGTQISGASGTATGMNGILGVISTNLSKFASGFVSLSAQQLEVLHKKSWDAVGASYVADTLICTMLHKIKIAGFSQRVTLNSNNTDAAYHNITMYDTASGTLTIVPHKDMPTAQGSVNIVLLNKSMFKVAYLRKPAYMEISKVGDADRGQYLAEATLESLAQRASVQESGYGLND
jgi:hypothetical protein